mmetsp:Transcript_10423/g.15692  ORF Transcript_10423/g.15692 Transcript_10423/m.15692 type:complete len:84 (+) Transcript_10423:52-303(+)
MRMLLATRSQLSLPHISKGRRTDKGCDGSSLRNAADGKAEEDKHEQASWQPGSTPGHTLASHSLIGSVLVVSSIDEVIRTSID